jgi:hypothetical protein
MALLKRDWMGSELADFERALLFDKDKEHWGWFEWVPGGRDSVFRLSKSPFLDPPGEPSYYILPEGYGNRPTAGQFVQVEVTGKPNVQKYPERLRSFQVKKIIPLSDKELFEVLPRPGLYLDEFVHFSTINYDNAEKDHLHHILPLQIVSCPSNEIGGGGLTVFRDSFIDDRREHERFKQGILDQIPTSFKSVNPIYTYLALSSKEDATSVKGLPKKCKEVNLLIDKGINLPVNLPVIQHQSRYHFRQPLTSDIVSYQLSALICRPHIKSKDVKLIEKSIIRVRKNMERSSVPIDFKPFAAVKVAEAMARLKLTQNNAIYRFLGKATGLLEAQSKVYDELLDGIWEQQVEKFADLKYMYDGMEVKSMLTGDHGISEGLKGFDSNLSRRDIRVLLELRVISQSSGRQNIPRNELKDGLGIDEYGLHDSLLSLRNAGYIIMLDNDMLIRALDLGDYSRKFDEALKK